jgi:hypothetical protein
MFKLTPDEVDDPDVAFQLRGAGFVARWLRRNLVRGKAFADGEIIEEVNAGLSMDQRGEKQAIRLIGPKRGAAGRDGRGTAALSRGGREDIARGGAAARKAHRGSTARALRKHEKAEPRRH